MSRYLLWIDDGSLNHLLKKAGVLSGEKRQEAEPAKAQAPTPPAQAPKREPAPSQARHKGETRRVETGWITALKRKQSLPGVGANARPSRHTGHWDVSNIIPNPTQDAAPANIPGAPSSPDLKLRPAWEPKSEDSLADMLHKAIEKSSSGSTPALVRRPTAPAPDPAPAVAPPAVAPPAPFQPSTSSSLQHRLEALRQWLMEQPDCEGCFVADEHGLPLMQYQAPEAAIVAPVLLKEALTSAQTLLPNMDQHLCIGIGDGRQLMIAWERIHEQTIAVGAILTGTPVPALARQARTAMLQTLDSH